MLQLVTSKPFDVVSSNLGVVTRTRIFLHKKKKMPNKWRTTLSLIHNGKRLNRSYAKFDFMVDEGKEWPNLSRERNLGKHRRRQAEKSRVTFLLYVPGWSPQT